MGVRLGLIATGGTIDSLGSNRLDMTSYLSTGLWLSEEALVDRVPELADVAEIFTVGSPRSPSHELTTADWISLANLIHEAVNNERLDGVIVTHGTNTLEETAWFLHLVLKVNVPVVLVGAMRPASAISSDGDLNLLRAAQVALSSSSQSLGVLVVMNECIFSARDVTKGSTYRTDAFCARDSGPLGFVEGDGGVRYYHRPERRHTTESEFSINTLRDLPRVDIILSYVGADGSTIDATTELGAQGIVLAGVGAGRANASEESALARARARDVAICRSTRTGSGHVLSTSELKEKGYIAAGNLVPWKARVLLALALTRSRQPAELQRIFDTY